jgi:hypothetical protein
MPTKASKKSKTNLVPEHKLFEKHPNHGNHLCELVAKRQMAKVAKAAKGATYLCHVCGRAANKKTALCEPVEI